MAEVRTCVFNVFISNAKHVHHQCQKCSSPAQNVFVASDKRVCLQCASYSEVNSRGYLVAGDKRACLQCDIVFGGEYTCSRGYLVASDDGFVCSVISYSEEKRVVFENWFRTPPKREQKLEGKMFLKKLHFK